ncbi:hypothetical protein SALBM135S_05971 [Streptomyces alboniger]
MASVWYAAYGSNMHLERLAAYIRGDCPAGGAREYPGCRDSAMPVASVPVELPGVMYFATRSLVWGGGRAFYDPAATGRVLGRAHLVTVEQFGDIAAQEMYREPGGLGAELDLSEVLARGRAVLGDGRYETLVRVGEIDSVPVLTFTAPWGVGEVPGLSPSAAYLRHLGAGLLAAGAWESDAVASYLAGCPGAAGSWAEQDVLELLG